MTALCALALILATASDGVVTAQQYEALFNLLPHMTSRDEHKLLRKPWLADATKAEQLIKRCERALDKLHATIAGKRCKWNFDYRKDGLDRCTSLGMGAFNLAKFACLRASLRFRQGKPGQAMDELTDVVVMARHVGTDTPYIGRLVQLAIESHVVDLCAAHLLDHDVPTRNRIGKLNQSMRSSPFLRCILKEKEFYLQGVRAKYVGMTQETFQKKSGGDLFDPVIREAAGGSLKTLLKFMDEVGPLYDGLAKLAALSHKEVEKEMSVQRGKHQANPLALGLVNSFHKLHIAETRVYAKWVMLQWALAIVEDASNQRRPPDDPFGEGLKYQAKGKGFELRSLYAPKGKPETVLSIGH